jgi:TonB-dependent SusC/RagA subfamily outer membrane receptor
MTRQKIFQILFITCCLCLAFQASAQQVPLVRGSIFNASGQPVVLATITNATTNKSTVSDSLGQFSIAASPAHTLDITATGYRSLKALVSSGIGSLVMEDDVTALEQVVVVGYSRQKKVNLTGAVSVVSGSELAKRPVFNTTVALQGALPGVTVSQFNGIPGASAEIRIRGIGTLGNNNPLVLIDGVVAAFADIDPNNIESISVLKDAASASIYGSRAAAGVILITSKRGKSGQMKVDYDAFFGFQQPVHKTKYLNAEGFMRM